MRGHLTTTASALLAVLCFINPETTIKIVGDNHKLAEPLVNKIKEAVGDKDGSQGVSLHWDGSEEDNELRNQFQIVTGNMKEVFETIQILSID